MSAVGDLGDSKASSPQSASQGRCRGNGGVGLWGRELPKNSSLSGAPQSMGTRNRRSPFSRIRREFSQPLSPETHPSLHQDF